MARTRRRIRATPNAETATLTRERALPRRGEEKGGVENLDKVRDILFGTQIRDSERRFDRLEERVAKDTGEVREEVRKRLDSLEAFLRKEIQSLLERIKTEQGLRGEAVKELGQELKEAAKGFQQRSSELQEQAAEIQRELRQEILDQSKGMRDELLLARTEASAEVERSAGELRAQKLDRAALSDMFTEMAARLAEPAE